MRHRSWYAKLVVGSFVLGAGMEFFMIKTGFYEKVTAIEAERRAEIKATEASQVMPTENRS